MTFPFGEIENATGTNTSATTRQITYRRRKKSCRGRQRKGRRGENYRCREPGPRAEAPGRVRWSARRGRLRSERSDHAGDGRTAASVERPADSSRRGARCETDLDGPAQPGGQADALARAHAASRYAAWARAKSSACPPG